MATSSAFPLACVLRLALDPAGIFRPLGLTPEPWDHNHALAALRYLIAAVDAGFLARFRKRPDATAEPAAAGPAPPRPARPSWGDESLWTPLS
jgi:hypothetical protein